MLHVTDVCYCYPCKRNAELYLSSLYYLLSKRTAHFIYFNAAASVGDGLATQHLSGLLCFPCAFFSSPPPTPPPAAAGQITISCRPHTSDIAPPPSLRVLLTMTLNLMPIKGWI